MCKARVAGSSTSTTFSATRDCLGAVAGAGRTESLGELAWLFSCREEAYDGIKNMSFWRGIGDDVIER